MTTREKRREGGEGIVAAGVAGVREVEMKWKQNGTKAES